MRQTCGQHSCLFVGSKHRVLESYFPVQICYMFLTPKCRTESNLGLCTTSGLAKRMRLRGSIFRLKNLFGRKFFRQSVLRSGILFASLEIVHRPESDCPLHFDSQNLYQIRMEKINASARCLLPTALLECSPQVCRVKITFKLLPTNRFVSTTTSSMKCLVNCAL